ncbi:putative membrane protein [Clostridium moniliforme]|uniref:Membrane protein n=1 Tax=Clostridium moniliforme TaxID=39489 RepID=A0ABS4EYF8_9CLOT|nr:YhgE/Pip domain-containing protein [Clostridium moniliforme]MBP1889025.1 putative membrane protein [Clostridium moniliforme]
MNKVISVFKRDMKAIIKNPVAMLIIVGVCVIPSLYAWVNIKACWNPYENTSTVPIAVVNNDKGTIIDNKEINMGNDVVSELKNNKAIGWRFVDVNEANLGIIDGKYYAMIEIPENFSKDLTSLATDNPVKPEIIYKVDTKANPVSGKITGIAKEQLVDQIKSNFVSTVNRIIFSSLNKVGEKLQKNKGDIIQLKNAIIRIDKNLNLIIASLDDTKNNAKNLNTYLTSIKSTLPQVTSGIDAMQDSTKQSKELTNYTKNIVNTSFSSLSINLNQIESSSDRMKALLASLNELASNGGAEGASTTISFMKQEISFMNKSIDNITNYLNELNKKSSNADISKMIASLNKLKESLNSENPKLDDLNNSLQSTGKLSNGILSDINSLNSSMSGNVNKITKEYNINAKKSIEKICNNYIKATEDANKLLGSSKTMVKNMNGLIDSALKGTSLTYDTSNDLEEKFNYFKSSIDFLSKKLSDISDDDLSEIVTILQSKPEVMGSYISDPFNVKDESIYKVPNYGSGMAPIYSVLAMWVGGLILTSLLTTDVAPFEGSENLTVKEKYLGKLLTFSLLGVIQGLIITLGDKLILGVYTVNPVLFIIFGMVASLCFSMITYTLVSLFGNIGKAMNIILLVIQIAGSGGTYPIQVDPKIFRILQPFFPFTYALGGVREAIAGPLVSSVVLDFTMLFVFSAIALIMGIFFKEKLCKHIRKFEDKFEESGISE